MRIALRAALIVTGASLSGCGPMTVGLTNDAATPAADPPQIFDDRDWAAILRENVKDGLVDYEHLAAHPESLNRFLELISSVGPESTPQLFPSNQARLAYYINVYNAGVLKAVLVEQVPATMYPFGRPALDHRYHLTVDRKSMTLVELRDAARASSAGDPRIEFALCAAAMGSPPLADQPWRADTIARHLDEVARMAMDHPRMVSIDHVGHHLLLALAIHEQRDAFLEYYTRLTRAPSPTLLNVLLMMAGSVRREWLNTAVGYPEGVIPFDRALNRWAPQ
jgi:hypothetical protein